MSQEKECYLRLVNRRILGRLKCHYLSGITKNVSIGGMFLTYCKNLLYA